MEISLAAPKRDWLALERKISGGKSIEAAAIECGIPMSEVFEQARESMGSGDAAQWQMMLIAQRAIAVGMTVLEKIAKDGPRYELSEGGVNTETGQIEMPEKLHNTDLDAAKALAKLGVDTARLSMGFMSKKVTAAAQSGAKGAGQNDLFDLLAHNPWDLNETENH